MKSATLDDLLQTLLHLRQDLRDVDRAPPKSFESLSPTFRESARNLLHYVALRRHDLREVQDHLVALGMSSLGRAEGSTLANLQAVLRLVALLAEQKIDVESTAALSPKEGRQLLEEHTRTLLGPLPPKRAVRIMVTMPGTAADDAGLIRDLLHDGMDCMRINCAHDNADAWGKMIAHMRHAEKELGRKCKVLMDLGGPKVRTGPMPPGPQVAKFRPHRDAFGRVEEPAKIWLADSEKRTTPGNSAAIAVPKEWLTELRVGDRIEFRDARGSKRELVVSAMAEGGCWADLSRTAYVTAGTELHLCGKALQHNPDLPPTVQVGELPEKEIRIFLKTGDILLVSRDSKPGTPARLDSLSGKTLPGRIGCTLPDVFANAKPNDSIWFDDGHLGGIIREVTPDHLRVEIVHAPPDGTWLGADKGINLPDTAIDLPALTEDDLANLPFIAAHADLIGYSFVRDAAGVTELLARVKECGGTNLGIVLKIETRRAFEHLPELLLAAMRGPSVGVMIARGDLAVECGFERLAEVQEEILWLSEAAHVPVIWATQVLENLAKTGFPSRAEITDAAMGERAECVMLNKGAHVRAAVQLLDGILRRMQGHQRKKSAMLRRLNVAHLFPAPIEANPISSSAPTE